METIIKIKNFESYLTNNKIIIDVGCGPNKRHNSLGIDQIDLENVDIVCNLENGLSFFPDNSVDEIYSNHFLEHINNFELILSEFHRILKPQGIAYIRVPHFSNPHFYSDYTHKRFFGYYTFYYFSKNQSKIKRKVPSFYNNTNFDILEQKFHFNYFIFNIKILKNVLNTIFNSSIFMQELYERSLCYIFPCKEIYIIIKPVK